MFENLMAVTYAIGYTALVLKNDSQNRESDFSAHPYGYEQTDASEKPTELQNITIKPM